MTLFVLDDKGGRTWQAIAPQAKELLVDDKRVVGTVPSGDVVIFHEESGTLAAQAKDFAKHGAIVIAVNLAGGDGKEQIKGYYQRKRGVDKPVDPHFSACLRSFITHLERAAEPDWSLIEGPPAPDALLAYHLLGMLPDDADAVSARRDLLGAALEEGRVIAEANELPTPTETEIQDRQYLRELLRR